MDLRARAVPGDKTVTNGRIGQCMEGTPGRGGPRVCQSGSRDGQEDGPNRGGFLYSDRCSTAG